MEIARKHVYDEETAEILNQMAREDAERPPIDDGDYTYGRPRFKDEPSPKAAAKRKAKMKAQRKARAKSRRK